MIGFGAQSTGLIRNCQSTFAVQETGAPSPSSQAVIRRRAPRLARMIELFDSHRLSEITRLVDVGSRDERSVVRKKLQRQREDERCYQGRHVLKGASIAQDPGAASDASLLSVMRILRPRERSLRACSTWFFRRSCHPARSRRRGDFVDERDRPVLEFSGSIAFGIISLSLSAPSSASG